jgi:hypothetical protein
MRFRRLDTQTHVAFARKGETTRQSDDAESRSDHNDRRHPGPRSRPAVKTARWADKETVRVNNGSVSKISVVRQSDSIYQVTVEEGDGRTIHDVTVTNQHLARYAPSATPERLLEAWFEFLLEREPKEAILTRFELRVIERYFPEYARTIASRL